MTVLRLLTLVTVLSTGLALPPRLPVEEISHNNLDHNSLGNEDIDAFKVEERLNNDNFPEPDADHVCRDKVMMEEEITYDEEERCNHVYYQSCHDTYKTVFKKSQIEKCKPRFKKSCVYTMKSVPKTHQVQICNENLFRDCDAEGEQVCTVEQEMVCEDEFFEHEVVEDRANCRRILERVCNPNPISGEEDCVTVPRTDCNVDPANNKKLMKKTSCRMVDREVCGPEVCPLTKGDPICRMETKTTVQEVPEEVCDMDVKKRCYMENSIMPALEPSTECVDVPKEICAIVKVNPQRTTRPVIKQWCGPADLIEPVVPGDDTTSNPPTPAPPIPRTDAEQSAAIIARDSFLNQARYEAKHQIDAAVINHNQFRVNKDTDFSPKSFRWAGLQEAVGGPLRQFADVGVDVDGENHSSSRSSRWSSRKVLF